MDLAPILAAFDLTIGGYNPKNQSNKYQLLKTGKFVGVPHFMAALNISNTFEWAEENLDRQDRTLLKELSTNAQKMDAALYECLIKTGVIAKRENPVDRSAFKDLKVFWEFQDDPGGTFSKNEFFTVNMKTMLLSRTKPEILQHLFFPGEPIIQHATIATRRYDPHGAPGFSDVKTPDGVFPSFNMYVPPPWKTYEGEVPDELPKIIRDLVEHVFPDPFEQKFFLHWVRGSLTSRAITVLGMCGDPGTGKTTIMLLLRALHGTSNSVSGKQSTWEDKFNLQYRNRTFAYHDEAKIDETGHNVIKGLMNNIVSFEGKGIDTFEDKMHASIVLANNNIGNNFLEMLSRKFAYLRINNIRLEDGMRPEDITEIKQKIGDRAALGEKADSYEPDEKFLAQIGRWIIKHCHLPDYDDYEYQGPMNFDIANSSLAAWRSKYVEALLEIPKVIGTPSHPKFKATESVLKLAEKSIALPGHKFGEGPYFFSEIKKLVVPKNTRTPTNDRETPRNILVQDTLKLYRDRQGRQRFEVSDPDIKDNVTFDFLVRIFDEDESKASDADLV